MTVIDNWQIYKGPFGVSVLRGEVQRYTEHGVKLPVETETHQFVWASHGTFGITVAGQKATARLKEGRPHARPYPDF